MKIASHELIDELMFLVNTSIRTSKFATTWKYVNVLPGFKNKGSRCDAKFYRPITNQSEISKLPERAIYNQVYSYLSTNNLIHENHHGFLQGCSTSTGQQQIVDFWMKSLDKGKLSAALFLDLSAGFDVVNHSILLDKLKEYGFDESAINWFKSYLEDRHQCVQVESAFSPFLPVRWGVPQGSILGPLIFLIYINELPALVEELPEETHGDEGEKNATIVIYADDNTPSSSHENPTELQRDMQKIANDVVNWFEDNDMVISSDKTKLLTIGTVANKRSKHLNNLEIEIQNKFTVETSSEK